MRTLLDTFCKAGGASKGYAEAGFQVTGVDIEPQEHYPYDFVQGDAIEFIKKHGHKFDVIAGSPPCQGYSVTRFVQGVKEYSYLIPPTREAMKATGRPYVIENVEGARAELHSPVKLCGSSFGLRVRRHRLFETNWELPALACDHAWQNASKRYVVRMSKKTRGSARLSGTVPVFGVTQLLFDGVGDSFKEWEACSEAMGVWWMTKLELNQAIPPAYTKYIGKHLIKMLE
jgi:DNA (cytosine-5)-methyltransferase 1